MNLSLVIITPQKVVLEDEADEIIAPTTTGQIAILPNHIGLLTKIEPGELIIKKGKTIDSFAITGGILEVSQNKVTVLADYAVHAQEIEIAKAIEAQKRAEQLMKQAKEKESEKDFVLAETELRRALLELKVGQKRRVKFP